MTVTECELMAGPFAREERRCDWCGDGLSGNRSRWCSTRCNRNFTRQHRYSWARKEAKRRDKYRCVKCGSRERLEVNHKTPCLGAHREFSCKHHVDKLETLCHDCHAPITKQQHADGLLKSVKGIQIPGAEALVNQRRTVKVRRRKT